MTDISKIFTATPRSLADFLSTNDQGCFIPAYQRGYAWSSDDVKRLFEDTVDGLHRLVVDTKSLRFLGTIIAIDDKSVVPVEEPMDVDLPNDVLTIIDGQQRLCTLIAVNIVLHDAIKQRRLKIPATPEHDAFLQIVDDYLFDLAKTVRFEGRTSGTIWRNYPRVIRAFEDQWSRNKQHARYNSPIARLIWRYIEHLEADDGTPFVGQTPQAGTKDDNQTALDRAVRSSMEMLDNIAEGTIDAFQLPDVEQLISVELQAAAFWADKFSNPVVDFVMGSSAAQQVLRLMAFGRYLNTRMAITVVTTFTEDYAFDMFEALNTTGQPLTAFETFRPKVIEFEGQANFQQSKSATHLDLVENYLSKFTKADEKLRATTAMLIPFALLRTGRRLEGRLSAQGRYLRTAYAALNTDEEKLEFTEYLGITAKFLGSSWARPAKESALVLPDGSASSDPVAGFCFEALRSLRHDVVIAPLVRFYAAAAKGGDEHSRCEYEGAIKAIAAFSMMWRAARGGTSNIDAQYRAIMFGGQGVKKPACLRQPDHSSNVAPTLSELQAALWGLLSQKRVAIGTKDAWVTNTSQRAIYEESNSVTRFLLLAASHNAVSDAAAPGLITGGGRGNHNLLTPAGWYDESTFTIEHIAPQGAGIGNWPSDLLADSRTRDQLGNLLLLPKLENNELADHDWSHKRALLAVFAAESVSDADAAILEAEKLGVPIGKATRKIAQTSVSLPLCKPVVKYDGEWDAAFVGSRSRRIAELAWSTMTPWLGPKPT
ncbi:hypothetical protein ASG47_19985 [Devosia sp. Leaf420]|uniref:DUF262 domain-containing protein n=1 Tax=Devosia sp. Leaf420 TaxID=1736374 RepID=UPI000712B50B|nr:DUF262 domain-containing protein [Devosia sp. Leaf420]KQT50210.1 hypothetical protein ASG47_19985 [Devosia sp. Leaf420]